MLFAVTWLLSSIVHAEPSPQVTLSKDVAVFTNWPIILLVLIGMIGFILALAWFVKRFGGMSFSGNREMKVVTSIPLGARERIALIDIKGQQFLIGVTTQQISHLHSFGEAVIPLDVNKKAIGQHDFAAKLQSVLSSVKANNASGNMSDSTSDNVSGNTSDNTSGNTSDNTTQNRNGHAS